MKVINLVGNCLKNDLHEINERVTKAIIDIEQQLKELDDKNADIELVVRQEFSEFILTTVSLEEFMIQNVDVPYLARDYLGVYKAGIDSTIARLTKEINDLIESFKNKNDGPKIRDVTNWVQLGNQIKGFDPNDQAGFAVGISRDGGTIAVGITGDDINGINRGNTRLYNYIDASNIWQQKGQDISGENVGDFFGKALSLSHDGNIVAITSPYNTTDSVDAGHTCIYKYSHT